MFTTAADMNFKGRPGEKKLMTDKAFFEEIVIKMELLVEVQKEIGLSHFDESAEMAQSGGVGSPQNQ